MRPSFIVYFVLLTVLVFLVELPREQVARWYLNRVSQTNGVDVAWQSGIFAFRSAYLDGVDVAINHKPTVFLDALNVVLGFDGSVNFYAMAGKGGAYGTLAHNELTYTADNFPVPGIPPAFLSEVTAKSTGHIDIVHNSGAGNVEASAIAGDVLQPLLQVSGKLTATGDYTLKNGGGEVHATIVGDKLRGRLDVTATSMPGNGPLMLEGALNAEINGQPRNFRIAGTLQAPQINVAPTAGPGGPGPNYPVPGR